MTLSSCLRPSADTSETVSAECCEDCTFCHVSSKNGFQVVYEAYLIVCQNTDFIAFQDRSPAAEHHFLVVPRRHIGSVKVLRQADVPLVKQMEEIGHACLDDLQVPPTRRRMGFHIPPFNSVDHLHLHVLGLPFRNWLVRHKYPIVAGIHGYVKGYSWFAEVSQTVQILQNGGSIKVNCC
ncbi:HIT-like protein [Auriscalpium vulgare]|uniref:HIT-like protein n=1 Tax=Auriscalpium vulgare TaxID=40419 RepID=A0ACB8RK22_9AGAM|nr:HIT-like protein [Auriscalpium vulgare]